MHGTPIWQVGFLLLFEGIGIALPFLLTIRANPMRLFRRRVRHAWHLAIAGFYSLLCASILLYFFVFWYGNVILSEDGVIWILLIFALIGYVLAIVVRIWPGVRSCREGDNAKP